MADFRIEDLTALRRWYALRGPKDGQAGITPEGRAAVPERWQTDSVLEDANRLLHMDPKDRKLWAEAIGLPMAPSKWSDPCPERPGDLTHARTASDPYGVCAHCGLPIQ